MATESDRPFGRRLEEPSGLAERPSGRESSPASGDDIAGVPQGVSGGADAPRATGKTRWDLVFGGGMVLGTMGLAIYAAGPGAGLLIAAALAGIGIAVVHLLTREK